MPVSGYLWQAGKFRFFDNATEQASLAIPTPARSSEFGPPPSSSSPPSVASQEDTPINRFGLTEVFTPPGGCDVDLVFIHGLNGEPKRTWTSKETQVYWPRDLLPSFIEEQKARVLVYGYDADVATLGAPGVSKDKIHNHAERLIADLFANRRIRKATERPIIFIAHSLGGLIVKRALISSSEISGAKTAHLRSIYISTYGILFLGTPHKGSNIARWGSYLSSLCQAVIPTRIASTESQLIEALQTNSETLLNIDRQFAQLMDEFHLFFFHEAKPTNLKGFLLFIVDEESAAPPLPDVERAGIQADHSHMCKFASKNAPGFDLVVDGIQRYSEQAPSIIQDRWVIEKRERLSRAVRKAKENYPAVLAALDPQGMIVTSRESSPHVSPNTSIIRSDSPVNRAPSVASGRSSTIVMQTNKPIEPFFIVPPGFRANAFFVGMQKEMHELDRRLFDSRRKDGTACVLLHGQPGAGKTHVARHYVFKNRYKFQGGVFWINAHLIDEVYRDFWQIHQRVVAKVSPELIHDSADKLDRNFIDEVRDWFSDREEWLIVFDGVSVEHDRDVNELQKFVPDSSNSGIIYVSRSRRLETIQRLLRPAAIKISGLKEDDASDLLFKELGIKNPRPAQVRSARALAKKVGGLPLAISAIARRLADTHEPIEKFNIKSYSDDPKLGGTYHHIISDLQKNQHTEAINLMNLLCFFGPHIPVEMIRLGLRALTKDGIVLKATEEGVHQDINVTFGILMRHALIERNEPDDGDSIASGRDSYAEPEPIDVLNLHAVIQKYWCDSLNTGKQLSLWLARAAKLFTSSYQEADLRIRRQPKPGRLSDYRWYLVHARRLRAHTINYDSKRISLRDIRADIDATIGQIEAEIKAREPGSSQESLTEAEFQISIFDRTSISSSTEPSQRGAPLSRLNTEDLESAIVDDSPLDGDAADYIGPVGRYSDRVQFPILYSYPMQKELSGSTLGPELSDGITMANTQQHGRPSAGPTRSDSFRSASAIPLIDRDHAQGLVYPASGLPPRGSIPLSWNALAYLTNLTQRSGHPHGNSVSASDLTSRHLSEAGQLRSGPLPLVMNPEQSIQTQEQAQLLAAAARSLAPDASIEDNHDRRISLQLAQAGMQPLIGAEQLTIPYAHQRSVSDSAIDEHQPLIIPTNMDRDKNILIPNFMQADTTSPYDPRTVLQAQSVEAEHRNSPRSRASSRTATQISPRLGIHGSAGTSGNVTPKVGGQDTPFTAQAVPPASQSSEVLGPRVRRSSPLPRGVGQVSTSPLLTQALLQPTEEVISQYPAPHPRIGDPTVYNHLSPTSQQYQRIIGSRAPYSDPLPSASSPLQSRQSSTSRRPSEVHGLNGLGIMHETGDRASSRSTNRFSRRERGARSAQQSNAASRHVSPSPHRDLSPSAPRQTLPGSPRADPLNELPGLSSTAEFAGMPMVSFAPPMQALDNGIHRRAGSAVENLSPTWLHQQPLQHTNNQYIQSQPFIDPFQLQHSTIINTVQGPFLVPQLTNTGDGNSAQIYTQRGYPNRNSEPYSASTSLCPEDGGVSGVRNAARRRRTLSAPESPGRSLQDEENFWAR